MKKKIWIGIGATVALLITFAGGVWLGVSYASPGFRLSPMDSTSFTVGDATGGNATLEITYSRPYARKRKIFGEVVKFDRVWRTGANEATAFSTTADVLLGDARIPAGDYTLYSLPRADGMTLIVNRQTGQWGTVYNEAQDLARVEMAVWTEAPHVEQFTLRFEETPDGGNLVLEWENTRASVPFEIADR